MFDIFVDLKFVTDKHILDTVDAIKAKLNKIYR